MSVETPVAPAPKPASVGSAFPPSTGEIKVSAMAPPASKPVTPAVPTPKPTPLGQPLIDDGKTPMGKTRQEKLMEDLRAKSKLTMTPDERDKPPEAPAKPGEKPAVPAEGEEGAPAKTPEVDPVKAAAKIEEAIDKKKTNPWKVIDEHKKARAQLEAENADLRKQITDPEARKKEYERLSGVEKRNQELEEQIRFVDYSKSKEFQEKYQVPYEQAWTRAMSELKELTIEDPDGNARQMAPQDLLELVNMPLKQARERADELYGASANEVMAYRKEIRGLYENQTIALDKAKKDGSEKFTRDQEQRQVQMKSVQEETGKYWEEYNKAILDNEVTGKYFKPVDGNEEINNRLEAGFKFVDETMAINPLNPKLTPEQRKEAVRRHASLRSRAAAFGRLRHELETALKELGASNKKLGEFEETVPDFGAGDPNAGAPLPTGNRMGTLMQGLRKIAK